MKTFRQLSGHKMLAEGHIGKCGVNPVCVAQGFQAGVCVCVSVVGAEGSPRTVHSGDGNRTR